MGEINTIRVKFNEDIGINDNVLFPTAKLYEKQLKKNSDEVFNTAKIYEDYLNISNNLEKMIAICDIIKKDNNINNISSEQKKNVEQFLNSTVKKYNKKIEELDDKLLNDLKQVLNDVKNKAILTKVNDDIKKKGVEQNYTEKVKNFGTRLDNIIKQ